MTFRLPSNTPANTVPTPPCQLPSDTIPTPCSSDPPYPPYVGRGWLRPPSDHWTASFLSSPAAHKTRIDEDQISQWCATSISPRLIWPEEPFLIPRLPASAGRFAAAATVAVAAPAAARHQKYFRFRWQSGWQWVQTAIDGKQNDSNYNGLCMILRRVGRPVACN